MIEVHVPDLDPARLAGLVLGDRRPGRRAPWSAAPRGRAPTPTLRPDRRLRGLASAGARCFLTSASVARTDSALSTTSRAARSIAAGSSSAEQRARVAHREPLVLDHLAHRRRQLEQPDRVRDRAAVLADALGDLLLRQPELVDQALERARPPRAARGRRAGGSRPVRARTRPCVSTSWTTTGTSCRPARCAARQRRSPAIRK